MRPKGPSLFRSDSVLGISGAPKKSIFESEKWGGTYHFFHQKWSPEGRKFGHFRDYWTEKVALSWRRKWDNFGSKIASPFVEGSIESSEIRAFDRAFNERASGFRFIMRVEILKEL